MQIGIAWYKKLLKMTLTWTKKKIMTHPKACYTDKIQFFQIRIKFFKKNTKQVKINVCRKLNLK